MDGFPAVLKILLHLLDFIRESCEYVDMDLHRVVAVYI